MQKNDEIKCITRARETAALLPFLPVAEEVGRLSVVLLLYDNNRFVRERLKALAILENIGLVRTHVIECLQLKYRCESMRDYK